MTVSENIPIHYLPPVASGKPPRIGRPQGPCGAYWAAVNAHVSAFAKDQDKPLRYAFNGAVMGMLKPAKPTRFWDRFAYARWLDRFAFHCEGCPGGEECSALKAAREMVAEGVPA